MLPNPLHPSLVHLPIAFLLFGIFSALISLFYYKRALIITTMIILVLATISTYIATLGGNIAETQLLAIHPEVKTDIESHSIQGYRLLWATIITTIFSCLPIYLGQNTKINKTLRLLTVLSSGAVLYFLFTTGETGAHIIYNDIIGIHSTKSSQANKYEWIIRVFKK